MLNTQSQKQLMVYKSSDGKLKLEVPLENETLWLAQQQIADLFSKDKATISRHIRNIYNEGELEPEATVAKNATVQKEGSRNVDIKCYAATNRK